MTKRRAYRVFLYIYLLQDFLLAVWNIYNIVQQNCHVASRACNMRIYIRTDVYSVFTVLSMDL